MRMTPKEMIEVIEAHIRGEKIECNYRRNPGAWGAVNPPSFNFDDFIYRIAKPEPKKIKLLGWVNKISDGVYRVHLLSEYVAVNHDWIRVPQFDCEVDDV